MSVGLYLSFEWRRKIQKLLDGFRWKFDNIVNGCVQDGPVLKTSKKKKITTQLADTGKFI